MKRLPRIASIPQHVGIIMDGNRRWAKLHVLPAIAGHRAGTENIMEIAQGCIEYNVPVLTLYAFSTENWERPNNEVRSLMNLFGEVSERETKTIMENDIQLRALGHLEVLPQSLLDRIYHVIEMSRNNKRLILNVAFNYGGRAEIVDAVRGLIRDGISSEEINKELFSRYLYTAGLPDPDLIIRTAGEMRLSNFLIWQAAYAEYYATPTYWPDFDKEELYSALLEYSRRERRFGILSESDYLMPTSSQSVPSS